MWSCRQKKEGGCVCDAAIASRDSNVAAARRNRGQNTAAAPTCTATGASLIAIAALVTIVADQTIIVRRQVHEELRVDERVGDGKGEEAATDGEHEEDGSEGAVAQRVDADQCEQRHGEAR